jgi:hypothetical protein
VDASRLAGSCEHGNEHPGFLHCRGDFVAS